MDEITVPSFQPFGSRRYHQPRHSRKKGLTTFYFPERPTSKPVIGKITEANFV